MVSRAEGHNQRKVRRAYLGAMRGHCSAPLDSVPPVGYCSLFPDTTFEGGGGGAISFKDLKRTRYHSSPDRFNTTRAHVRRAV